MHGNVGKQSNIVATAKRRSVREAGKVFPPISVLVVVA
jgi:hypothetical protein